MVVPNIQTIDLATYLNANSSMADVKFIFRSPVSKEVKEILAHKLVLSCGSEVFQTQFYGSIQDQEEILVEDSSYEAFKLFLDILYNQKVEFKSLTFQLLAEMFYLAEKYRIDTLKKVVTDTVLAKRIDTENLLIAAKVAEDNALMEDFSTTLYESCSNYVSQNPFQVLKMFANQDNQDEEANTSLSRVTARVFQRKEMESCPNCKHSPCLDGVFLTIDDFVLDAKIMPEGFENEDPPRLRRVLKMDKDKGMVHYSISGQMEIISKLLVAQKYKFRCR